MKIFQAIVDSVLGKPIRKIISKDKVIYLTFDDGPNRHCTPKVLELLSKYNARATFFVVGKNVECNVDVFNQIKNEKHSIGNHSYDHNYMPFFKGVKRLRQWIEFGEDAIVKQLGVSTVGFRPPAGIRTPELRYIMYKRKECLILWQHRFYDTVSLFTDDKWKKKFSSIESGDIILLHDSHKEPDEFLNSLENFINALINAGFKLCALPSQ
ncbi:MAG: polysaccharide deacetylase family protein [Gammaproteobacteria bacterium]|nr:polysaccharide deacetylase family protein [Gammaproteobacteria bacterium]